MQAQTRIETGVCQLQSITVYCLLPIVNPVVPGSSPGATASIFNELRRISASQFDPQPHFRPHRELFLSRDSILSRSFPHPRERTELLVE